MGRFSLYIYPSSLIVGHDRHTLGEPVRPHYKMSPLAQDQARQIRLSSEIIEDEGSRRACEDHILNTLRPRQNGRHFADDTFKSIFINENVWM